MVDYQWMGSELPTFVTHLECSLTGERYPADTLADAVAGRQAAAGALRPRRRAPSRSAATRLSGRPQSLWRYRELLPVRRPENVRVARRGR